MCGQRQKCIRERYFACNGCDGPTTHLTFFLRVVRFENAVQGDRDEDFIIFDPSLRKDSSQASLFISTPVLPLVAPTSIVLLQLAAPDAVPSMWPPGWYEVGCRIVVASFVSLSCRCSLWLLL